MWIPSEVSLDTSSESAYKCMNVLIILHTPFKKGIKYAELYAKGQSLQNVKSNY